MKPEQEYHVLLDDVLTESVPADFEPALLDGTLRAVRRRRRSRRLARGLSVVGLCTAIALALWNSLWPRTPAKWVRPALNIVHTRPLPPSMIVRTKPDGVAFISSSAATFQLVETGAIKDPFKEIDDEQLLALAGGRRVALVRQAPHQAELIFLDLADKDGFPVQ